MLDLQQEKLQVAHTADPDDAFAWWAIANGHVSLNNYKIELEALHIQDINEACIDQKFDIAAVSSAAWPHLYKNYCILASGASVGRGYGPVIASASAVDLNKDVTVAIPGELTTGALLLRLFYPNVKTVSMPFDQIAEAISLQHVDAGVLIHEELLNWQNKGLQKVQCLGKKWQDEMDLPIPVGLNIVHRRLGEDMKKVQQVVCDSMQFAAKNEEKAKDWGRKYTIETKRGIAEKFMQMFANEDTLRLQEDCVRALHKLYEVAYAAKLIPCIPDVDIIW